MINCFFMSFIKTKFDFSKCACSIDARDTTNTRFNPHETFLISQSKDEPKKKQCGTNETKLQVGKWPQTAHRPSHRGCAELKISPALYDRWENNKWSDIGTPVVLVSKYTDCDRQQCTILTQGHLHLMKARHSGDCTNLHCDCVIFFSSTNTNICNQNRRC